MLIIAIAADIDECSIEGSNNCSLTTNTKCVNTNGSYTCVCDDNFITLPDGTCGCKYTPVNYRTKVIDAL